MYRLAGGGGHNDVRLVQSKYGKFVVRCRLPPVVRAGSDALLELQCQRLAAQEGLAPQIFAAAGDASWMVMEFIPGAPWPQQELLSASGIGKLGARLALVHAIPVAATMQVMDAGFIARAQVDAIHATAASIQLQREAADLERRTDHLAAILRSSGAPRCINHGDLQLANLIGGLPVLIDWEYAQVAAPTYDVACLLTYYPQLQGWQSELLAACGLTRPEDLELLGQHRQLFSCLNRLWAIAHGTDSGLGAG